MVGIGAGILVGILVAFGLGFWRRNKLWLMLSYEILGWDLGWDFGGILEEEAQSLPHSHSMGSPFTSHWMVGLGFPLARHTNLPSSPGARIRFSG